MAKGFSQVEEIDYYDEFNHVSKMDSKCLVHYIDTSQGLSIYQIYVRIVDFFRRNKLETISFNHKYL